MSVPIPWPAVVQSGRALFVTVNPEPNPLVLMTRGSWNYGPSKDINFLPIVFIIRPHNLISAALPPYTVLEIIRSFGVWEFVCPSVRPNAARFLVW